ncbi:hypothetical protein R69927_07495 [Paraburkholderia domus]|uniref:ABC transporter permease n=1 Tax=Paraburkholderia domus TaxID=2793075 RepID=UPI0019130614|nr:ABC transporter permease [Paraburkholderia domus]MBK5091556.1 ABC transporter permease [Burkholderia sp. R-69927]CAE6937357.1 hypothetical protein R69927_07495 [Paraburkholderia domus]
MNRSAAHRAIHAVPESQVSLRSFLAKGAVAYPWLASIVGIGAWCFFSNMPAEIYSYRQDIVFLGIQHIELVIWAGGFAVLTGVSAGALLSRPAFRRSSELILQIFNLGTTIPTLAILALCMTILGIGAIPAIFGLWAATLLPIVRNTYTGLRNVPAPLLEAARGMGMTNRQIFFQVEVPNSLFAIFGGVRTGLAICVGTAPLAFLVGAKSLGELIFTGIALNELPMMLAGAIPTAILAILTDLFAAKLQYYLVSRGINPQR